MKLIEAIRDRLVQRSLIGKRKLDRGATRRQLDALLRDLGERFRELVRTGRMEVPPELAPMLERVREIELRLEEQQRDIEALENETPTPSTT
ncbi:MAG TPA: hypothetical protein VF875_17500 [Anaeromyxobacter sp.]